VSESISLFFNSAWTSSYWPSCLTITADWPASPAANSTWFPSLLATSTTYWLWSAAGRDESCILLSSPLSLLLSALSLASTTSAFVDSFYCEIGFILSLLFASSKLLYPYSFSSSFWLIWFSPVAGLNWLLFWPCSSLSCLRSPSSASLPSLAI